MTTARTTRTRAGNRWTEARFWAFLRSALRAASVRWPPKADALRAARRPYTAGDNPRQRWEYQCAKCGGWFAGKRVALDHIVPCGELRDWAHVADFARRLYCEADGYRVLCEACHGKRHKHTQTRADTHDNTK